MSNSLLGKLFDYVGGEAKNVLGDIFGADDE